MKEPGLLLCQVTDNTLGRSLGTRHFSESETGGQLPAV